ncbi:MAG TPA: ATP-binding protein [Terriglobales bacterium]
MRKLSIGFRLTLWYLAIFAAGQLIFACGLWFVLRHNLYNIMDETLAGQVQDVQRFLEAQKPKNEAVAKLQEEFTETYALQRQGDYLQVFNSQGDMVYRASFLREHALARAQSLRLGQPAFEDRELDGQAFRFLNQMVEVRGRRFLVQVGLPTREMLTILLLFQRCLFMLAPPMLALAAGVGHWLSSRALAPVDALTRTARTISAHNLSSRLEKLTTGDELQRLSDTLNDMLARIEGTFVRITEFTADASHELRTPVALIRTEAEIALRRSRSPEDYRHTLRHILLKAENTSTLVERLLSLARADSGREALHMSPLNLCALASEIADEWRPQAVARGLEFDLNTPCRDLVISADSAALQRLLTALLDNALRYTSPPGIVTLSLSESQGKAMITVRDTGIGISQEDQARIFERFFRADNARGQGVEGAGLGLAIADWIVQQHHGAITVDSRLGEGAVFVVVFPLLEPLPSAVEPIENVAPTQLTVS